MPVHLKLKRDQPPANGKKNNNHSDNGEALPQRATHQRMQALAAESRRLRTMTIGAAAVVGLLLILGIVSLAKAPPESKRSYRQPPRPPARPGASARQAVASTPAPGTQVGATIPAPEQPTQVSAAGAGAAESSPVAPAAAAETVPVQVTNGDFETGNLQGWTPSGMGGGAVQLVQAGTRFPGQMEEGEAVTDTDQIPFREGQWAVCLRSSGPGTTVGAAAILTSLPLKVTKSWLRWDEMAESEEVTTELRVLDSATGVELAIQRFTRSRPRTTRNDVYWERQSFELSRFVNRTVQIQFRQYTAEGGNGWFTLIDNIALE